MGWIGEGIYDDRLPILQFEWDAEEPRVIGLENA
jgi:hypothetical protein